MEFNWFTFAAQIINFLILVFLLKHFLFSRILRYMDERNRKIQEQLESARKQQAAADALKQRLNAEKAELGQRKDRLIAEARQDAEAQKRHMLEAARQDVASQHDRWLSALEQEQSSLMKSFEEETLQYVLAVSEKILNDLGNTSLQKQVTRKFLEYYRALPADQKETLRATVREAGTLEVLSGIPLEDNLRSELVRELNLPVEQIGFSIQPELLAGLRVKTGGYKLDWNVHAYLRDLEAEFLDALQQHRRERQKTTEAKYPKTLVAREGERETPHVAT